MRRSGVPPLEFLSACAAALVITGCGQSAVDSPVDARLDATQFTPSATRQVFAQPELVISPGTEVMQCWVVDWTPDEDIYIRAFKGHQALGGHHVAAFSSAFPREPGATFDCTDNEDMVSLSPLILPDPEGENLLPPGFAVRLPAKTNIVIQSHYLNTTDRDMLVSDIAEFVIYGGSEPPTVASYLIMNHGEFELSPGVTSTTLECDMETDVSLMLMLGHMHEHGTSMSVTRERNGNSDILYGIDQWTVDLRDQPVVKKYANDEPLRLVAGDHLALTCNYDNRTEGPLKFPEEMCTMVSYYYPARFEPPALPNGLIFCDN